MLPAEGAHLAASTSLQTSSYETSLAIKALMLLLFLITSTISTTVSLWADNQLSKHLILDLTVFNDQTSEPTLHSVKQPTNPKQNHQVNKHKRSQPKKPT